MHTLKVRNVHEALPNGIGLLDDKGYERNSRYGEVIKLDEPVVIKYSAPLERVCLWEERDCNPFLHLFESLYFLAGRDDVGFLTQFGKRMAEFSDDGKTLHGSYGKRWRSWFGVDQIAVIIKTLSENPDDRRCVLQMWDAESDLGKVGKDFPCNTQVYFSVDNVDRLDMTVCQRSGDAIWGVHGANAVSFSVLQEYIAKGINKKVGRYWQIVNNYHSYLSVFKPLKKLKIRAADPYRVSINNPYTTGEIKITEVVDYPIKVWDEDLAMWLADPYKIGIRSQFFLRTATPMMAAHKEHKKGNTKTALEIILSQMDVSSDWAVASKEWLERRLK